MILLMMDSLSHASDGDLLRLLDGECGEEEEKHLRTHLATCAECLRNERKLAAVSEQFSAVVQDLESAGPVRLTSQRRSRLGFFRRWTRHLRSGRYARSGAVLLLMAVALAVSPLRAWILDRMSAISTLAFGGSSAEEQAQLPSSTVSFVVSGDRLLVEFSNRQAGGVLAVAMDTGSLVQITGASQADELLVFAAGVRIRNSSESSASYDLRIPRSIDVLEVRIAGLTVAKLELAGHAGSARWQIDLRHAGNTP
jgi:hypothetical protein